MTKKQSETEILIENYSNRMRLLSQRWIVRLGGQPSPIWRPEKSVLDELEKLFQVLHFDNKISEDLDQACRQITRGAYLVGAALEWEKPRVGNAGHTSQVRGEQWRVTLAWAGLETLTKATVGGLQAKHLEHLSQVTELETPLQLKPPSTRLKKLQEAREWPSSGNQQHPMLEYLGVRGGFATEMLKRWLVEGKSLKRSHELLGCAQAIRHATAHGALSSSCLKGWGIQPALVPLTATIAGTAVGILEVLMSNE